MLNGDLREFSKLTNVDQDSSGSLGYTLCQHWFATDPSGYMAHRAQEIAADATKEGNALV